MSFQNDLVSYWKFDESSGNAADSFGPNTLTNNGTATFAAGKINNSCVLNGSSQDFSIADASQTGLDPTGSFSISCWVNPNTQNAVRTIVARDKAGSRCLHLAVYASNGGGVANKLFCYINDTSYAESTSALTSGTWYHLVFTYQYVTSGTSVMTFYLNGNVNGTPTTNAVGPMTNSTGTFNIGSREYSTARLWWNGSIDEFGYWARALSAPEVTTLYNGGQGLTFPFPTAAFLKKFV